MPVTIPLDVYRLIFECFSVRYYHNTWKLPSSGLDMMDLAPFLSDEADEALDALSLTCKTFNEFSRDISLRDTFINSFDDFTQLCVMTRHCRVFPIETLDICPEARNDPIQDITSAEFLLITKKCVRLRGLWMTPLLVTSSRLSFALESLAQCGTLANLRSLELYLVDDSHSFRGPDPNDLARVLLLMPNLTMLHIYIPIPSARGWLYNRHEPSELPPPPFRLEYLVINETYLDVEWLTSTSHNHLRVAHFEDNDPLLNLEHPRPKLLYLNYISDLPSAALLKTLCCCPNLAFLAMGFMNHLDPQGSVKFFDALQRPLIGLTLAYGFNLEEVLGGETHFAVLATAVENHPALSELSAFTIELRAAEFHEKHPNRTLHLQRACEARGIQFAIVCDKSDPCEHCGTPGYVIPLPHEL